MLSLTLNSPKSSLALSNKLLTLLLGSANRSLSLTHCTTNSSLALTSQLLSLVNGLLALLLSSSNGLQNSQVNGVNPKLETNLQYDGISSHRNFKNDNVVYGTFLCKIVTLL